MSVKCSGVRFSRKKTYRQCKLNGWNTFDWFCCANHRDDSKLYAGAEVFDAHVDRAKHAYNNKAFRSGFNQRLRCAFQSIIIANKERETVEYSMPAEVGMLQQAKSAWEGVEAMYDNTERTEVMKEVKEVCRRVKGKLLM
jgi:hypothetical protein